MLLPFYCQVPVESKHYKFTTADKNVLPVAAAVTACYATKYLVSVKGLEQSSCGQSTWL